MQKRNNHSQSLIIHFCWLAVHVNFNEVRHLCRKISSLSRIESYLLSEEQKIKVPNERSQFLAGQNQRRPSWGRACIYVTHLSLNNRFNSGHKHSAGYSDFGEDASIQ